MFPADLNTYRSCQFSFPPLPTRNRAILYLHDVHVPLKCISEDARCNIYGFVVSVWLAQQTAVARFSELWAVFVARFTLVNSKF